jgi:hypothetical protein
MAFLVSFVTVVRRAPRRCALRSAAGAGFRRVSPLGETAEDDDTPSELAASKAGRANPGVHLTGVSKPKFLISLELLTLVPPSASLETDLRAG